MTPETEDWLIIHLAQSFAYLEERTLKKTLAWRAKSGKPTKKDLKFIDQAKRALSIRMKDAE